MKPESQALLDKAWTSLSAAAYLMQEKYYDYAATRAYYAMFYAAQALLLEQELSYKSHSAVIAAYGREYAKSGKLDARFHLYLLDAQDMRNIADYGINPSITKEQASESMRWA